MIGRECAFSSPSNAFLYTVSEIKGRAVYKIYVPVMSTESVWENLRFSKHFTDHGKQLSINNTIYDYDFLFHCHHRPTDEWRHSRFPNEIFPLSSFRRLTNFARRRRLYAHSQHLRRRITPPLTFRHSDA